jgi:outer membrane protein assembly factor BamB
MFRGNPELTGIYNSKAVNELEQVQFIFRTNGAVRSSPVIADNILYAGSNDGNFYALDSKSGKEIWRFKTKEAVTSTAAVYNGTVWFASRDSYFYALSAKNGKEIWKFKMGKDLKNEDYQDYWDYYLSSPNISNGNVYIGSGDGFLYAFNSKTKKNIWKYNANSRIRSTPAVSGQSVVFGTMDGHLISVDANNGTLKWKFAVDGASFHFDDKSNDRTSVFCSPSIGDNIVTVGGRDGFLYGVNLNTGNLEWKTTHDGSSWILSTGISGNTLYVGSGSAFILQAAELKTGKEKWRFKTKSAVFSSISITGNTLYFADIAGVVYALDKNTGKKNWEFAAGTRIFSTPVVYNGRVYFGSDDGNIYSLKGSNDNPGEKLSPYKIVYWEGPQTDTSFIPFQFNTDLWMRDYFVGAGYKLMDKDQLVSFIKNQEYKNYRSVIVLSDNKIPVELLEGYSSNCLLRKYLNDGGKIAALGDNPIAYKLDPKTGVLDALDYKLADNVLGIKFIDPRYSRGYYPSIITDDGKKWGLHKFWTGNGFVIDTNQVTEVLAVNEFGKATSWIKNYGGPKGTGWLQFNASSYKGIIGELIYQFRTAIEYGIEW